ncbi:Signal peptide peptidase-like 3, partial [Durusdinium trenchii]
MRAPVAAALLTAVTTALPCARASAAALWELSQRVRAAKLEQLDQITAIQVVQRTADRDSELFKLAQAVLAAPKWTEHEPGEYFDVLIQQGHKVGIMFEEDRDKLKVQELQPDGQAAKSKMIQIGDELVAINLEGISGYSLHELGEKFAQFKPLDKVFRFRRPLKPRQQLRPKHRPLQQHRQGQRQQPATAPGSGGGAAAYEVHVSQLGNMGISLFDDLTVQSITPTSDFQGRIHVGDRLIQVAGESTAGLTLAEVVRKIKRARYPVQLANFGVAPTCQVQNLTALRSKSRLGMACKPLQEPQDAIAGSLLFVLRGECTFVTKARRAEAMGAAGIIVVTRDFEPVVAMPAGAGELRTGPVPLAAGMMSWADGSALHALLKSGPLQGILEGPGCDQGSHGDNTADLEREDEEKYAVEDLGDGRTRERHMVAAAVELMLWTSVTQQVTTYFGILADFGPTKHADMPTLMQAEPMVAKLAPEPMDACEPLKEAHRFQGAAVVVLRGKCTYAEKALNIQSAGGKAMILINHDPERKKLHPMI